MRNNPLVFLVFLWATAYFAVPVQAGTAAKDTINPILPLGMTDVRYEQKKLQASSLSDETNPGKMFFILLIRFYQVVFSSQDGSSCQFRPSCSHFGADALKHHGLVQGVLMTSDRLLRCNPYTEGLYPMAPDGQHREDPTEKHLLWSEKKKP